MTDVALTDLSKKAQGLLARVHDVRIDDIEVLTATETTAMGVLLDAGLVVQDNYGPFAVLAITPAGRLLLNPPDPADIPIRLDWATDGVILLDDQSSIAVFQSGTFAVRATLPDGNIKIRVLPTGTALKHPDLPQDQDYANHLRDVMAAQVDAVVVETEEVTAE